MKRFSKIILLLVMPFCFSAQKADLETSFVDFSDKNGSFYQAFKIGDNLITLYKKESLGKNVKYLVSKYDKSHSLIKESEITINKKETSYFDFIQLEGKIYFLTLKEKENAYTYYSQAINTETLGISTELKELFTFGNNIKTNDIIWPKNSLVMPRLIISNDKTKCLFIGAGKKNKDRDLTVMFWTFDRNLNLLREYNNSIFYQKYIGLNDYEIDNLGNVFYVTIFVDKEKKNKDQIYEYKLYSS